MKKISIFSILLISTIFAHAQMYIEQSANGSITLTPKGILSKGASNNSHTNAIYGSAAFGSNVSGNNNSAFGYETLKANTTGNNNTAFGANALESVQIGSNNVAVGSNTLRLSATGFGNVGIGNNTLGNSISGSTNVAIGSGALQSLETGASNVAIGYRAGYSETSNNNTLYIANTEDSSPLIGGVFDLGRVGINRTIVELKNNTAELQLNGLAFKTEGTGSWLIPSDKRLKEEIKDLNASEVFQKIINLQGVTYYWKDKTHDASLQFGFIAQELQKQFPHLVQEGQNGFLSASYGSLDAMFVEAIKVLNKKIEKLETENSLLKNAFEERLQRLEASKENDREKASEKK